MRQRNNAGPGPRSHYRTDAKNAVQRLQSDVGIVQRKSSIVDKDGTIRSRVVVKPTPPADLWTQLDALLPNNVNARPENSFTSDEFAKRKGLSDHRSQAVLKSLTEEGKLTRVRFSNRYYYSLVTK
jgi:hypothetical protein